MLHRIFDANRLRMICLCILPFIAAGQTSPEKGRLTTTLTEERVIELATACIEQNGFVVPDDLEWTTAIQNRETGLVWSVHTSIKGHPDPFWIHVDETTEHAEFVMPIIVPDARDEAGRDWLIQTYLKIVEIEYPVRFEDFLRRAYLSAAKPTGGGNNPEKGLYLNYTLREDSPSPARFIVRVFHKAPPGAKGTKLVTDAQLIYIDSATYEYQLKKN